MSSAIAVVFLTTGVAVSASPQDGQVVAGSATITYNGSTTNIIQHTQKAILDWRSFDIQSHEHVDFIQPSNASIALNRIRDIKPSQIDGKLTANGKIILINPNGVVFGQGAQIDVAGLTATTADIQNNDFMGSRYEFNIAGRSDGKIINNGTITIKDAGLVNLVAPRVENHGVIHAHMGRVNLAAGDIFTLDFAGDDLIKIGVHFEDAPKIVLNTGLVRSEGGTILMTAATARDAVDSIVQNSGILEAKSMTNKAGRIILGSAATKKTINAGSIDVSGHQQSAQGGQVLILGQDIQLTSASRINASGTSAHKSPLPFDQSGSAALTADRLVRREDEFMDDEFRGAGSVRIGGDYLGGGDVPRAQYVVVESGALILNDAVLLGDGGRTIIWSDGATIFDGFASVKAGEQGGHGGFVETSGYQNLRLNGLVDASSVHGEAGLWLLDPANVTIIRPGGNNVVGGTNNPTGLDYYINADSIQTVLNGGSNVTITTSFAGADPGIITVNATLSWATANMLQLRANSDIVVNQQITGRSLQFYSDGDVVLNANIVSNSAGAGNVQFYSLTAGGIIGVGDDAAGTLHLSNSDLSRISGFSANDGILIGDGGNTSLINIAYSGAYASGVRFVTNAAGTIHITGNSDFSQGASNNIQQFIAQNLIIDAAVISGRDMRFAINNYDINANITGASNSTISMDRRIAGSIGIGDAAIADTIIDSNSFSNIVSVNTLNIGGGNTNGIHLATNITVPALTRMAFNGNMIGSNVVIDGNINANNRIFDIVATNLTINNPITNIGGYESRLVSDTIAVNAAITGNSSRIRFEYRTQDITVGIGDGSAGTWSLDTTELGRITGFNNVNFGNNNWNSFGAFVSDMEIAAYDWRSFHPTANIQFAADNITVNGDQIFGAGVFYHTSSSPIFNGTITQANANQHNFTVTGMRNVVGGLYGYGPSSIGIGDGAAGNVLFSDVDVTMLRGSGYASLIFGAARQSTLNIDMDYNDVWNQNLQLMAGPGGTVSLSGDMQMSNRTLQIWAETINLSEDIYYTGAGNLTLVTNNLTWTGDVYGNANILNIYNYNGGGSIVIGDDMIGNLTITQADLINLEAKAAQFTSLRFGWNGHSHINIRDINWGGTYSTLAFNGSSVTINAAQDFGSKNVSFSTLPININAPITGTGRLQFQNYNGGTTVGLGDGTGGQNVYLSDAELNRIDSTFLSVDFYVGTTGTMTIARQTPWNFNSAFYSSTPTASIVISHDQDFLSYSALFQSNNLTVNGDLVGTGDIRFNSMNNSGIGIGNAAAGALKIDSNIISRIGSGFNRVWFGAGSSGQTIDLRAMSYNFNAGFQTSAAGAVVVNGEQNFTDKNAIMQTLSFTANADLIGTGTLQFLTTSAGQSIIVGNNSTGTLRVNETALGRIQEGFSELIFGDNTTVQVRANSASAWAYNDTIRMETSAAGTIFIDSHVNVGAGDLILSSGIIELNTNVSGTGNLVFKTSNPASNMEIGSSGTHTWSLDDSEIARIQNGFSKVQFGSLASTGDMIVNTVDISGLSSNFEMYANDITLAGITLGSGNFMAYAMDNESGADKGDLLVSAAIIKPNTIAGHSRLDLRADQNVTIHGVAGTEITAQSGGSNPSLDILLNSNRDGEVDGGYVWLRRALNSNGGVVALTGGFVDDGRNGGVAGDGIADDYALGLFDGVTSMTATGVYFDATASINSGAGDVFVFGKGEQNSPTEYVTGVRQHAGMIQTTTGNITINGYGGTSATQPAGMGYYLPAGGLTTQSGKIDIYAYAPASIGGVAQYPMLMQGPSVISSTGSVGALGDITIKTLNDGTHPYGMEMRFFSTGSPQILTNGANINIIDESTVSTKAVRFADDSKIETANGGDIQIIANNIIIGAVGTPNIYADGNLIVKPFNPATSIGLGGGGGTLNLDDAELGFMNAGNMFIIGDALNAASDVIVQSWNLSNRFFDTEIYGRNIELNGVTLGAGNFLVHAREVTGVGGNVHISGNITRAVQGIATLNIRADESIYNSNSADIIATDSNVDGDGDDETNPDSLNVIFNADRDANQSGYIYLLSGSVTTLGGDIVLGGGANPNNEYAYGKTAAADEVDNGVSLRGSAIFNAGGGHIVINGHGKNEVDAENYGVQINTGLYTKNSGTIKINGIGGQGINSNNGVIISGVDAIVETQNGNIDIIGIGRGTGTNNIGVLIQDQAKIRTTGTTAAAGNIYIEGRGANGTTGNSGIVVLNQNTLISSHTGNIHLLGTSGNGTNNNVGLHIQNSAFTANIINSVNGNIHLEGYGHGAGSGNRGVSIFSNSVIKTTGSGANLGNIEITGVGGNGTTGNIGVYFATSSDLQTQDGDIKITGTGGNGTSGNYGVHLYYDPYIVSLGTGDITIIGTGGNGTTQNYGIMYDPINIIGNREISTQSGDILFRGYGGNGTTQNYGIYMLNQATIESKGLGGGAGTITLEGYGGLGSNENYGVYLTGAGTEIKSADGDIEIIAEGGSNGGLDSDTNYGIFIQSSAKIRSTGVGANAAKITLTGTGGAGDDYNQGIVIVGTGSEIASVNGDILLKGYGNFNGELGTAFNHGIFVGNGGAGIRSTGTGAHAAKITIEGYGDGRGDDNYGVYLNHEDSFITSVDGDINITAVGSTGNAGSRHHGLYLKDGPDITSTGLTSEAAKITLNATGYRGGNGIYIQGGIVSSGYGDIDIDATGTGESGLFVSNFSTTTAAAKIISSGVGAHAASINIQSSSVGQSGTFLHVGGAIETNDGDIDITGTGSQRGVWLRFSSRVESFGDGHITINGTSTGTSGAEPISGVDIRNNSSIRTVNGDIYVVGQGGNSTHATGNGYGISFTESLTFIRSTGSGNITLEGTGGDCTNGSCYGVYLNDAAGQYIQTTGTGNIHITGTGGNIGTNNHGIYLIGGSYISSTGTMANAGTVTLHGTGGNGTDSNNGINLGGAGTRVSSVNGDIYIQGYGGGNGSLNRGLFMQAGAAIESTGVTENGAGITLYGEGSNTANGSFNQGIILQGGNSRISSLATGINAKPIDITAIGGMGAGGSNMGFNIVNGGDRVTSVDSDIIIRGTANSAGNNNIGARIAHGYIVATGLGDIRITGTGSSNGLNQNYGVFLERWNSPYAAEIVSAQGDIIINATAGGTGAGDNNHGLYFSDSANGGVTSIKSTGGGDINITAISGSGSLSQDLYLQNDIAKSGISVLGHATMSGDIILNIDSYHSDAGNFVRTLGDLSIRPRTASRTIGLGGGAGNLNIDDIELSQIDINGDLSIGNSNSGNIHLDSFNFLTNVAGDVYIAGADLRIDGSNNFSNNLDILSSGEVTLHGDIVAGGAGDSLVMRASKLTNLSGSNALQTPSGRYLIYLPTIDDVKKDGLTGTNFYNKSYALNPPSSLVALGNLFLFNSDEVIAPPSTALPTTVESAIQTPDWLEIIKNNLPLYSKLKSNNDASETVVSQQSSETTNILTMASANLSPENDAFTRMADAGYIKVDKKLSEFFDLCALNQSFCD